MQSVLHLQLSTIGRSSTERQHRRAAARQRRRAAPAPRAAQDGGLVAAGPGDAPPDYTAIDSQPLNRAVYSLFRRRMVAAVGADSPLEGCAAATSLLVDGKAGCCVQPAGLLYERERAGHRLPAAAPPPAPPTPPPALSLLVRRYAAIIDLTRRLNSMHATPRGTQEATVAILRSLFPPWLPGAFAALFSRNVPAPSARLNAWATALTCQWLMGPSEVNDVEVDGGAVAPGQGVLVAR